MQPQFQFQADGGWGAFPAGMPFREVADASIDRDGNVYLFTRDTDAVMVLSAQGAFRSAWGTGIFSKPHGIRVIGEFVYCVDSGDHTVRKFTLEGTLLQTLGIPGQASDTGWNGGYNGTICRAAGPFNACTCIASAPNGDLYVSDGYGNCRVHRFSSNGLLKQSWGEPGTGEGEFHLPHGIHVTLDERVLVADRENDRIQVFDSRGRFLEQWGSVQRPCAIAEDKDGFLFVAELPWRPGDRPFRRAPIESELPGGVSILSRSGKLVQRIEPSAPQVSSRADFVAPHGICVDTTGSFYLAEVSWAFAGRQGRLGPNYNKVRKFTRELRAAQ